MRDNSFFNLLTLMPPEKLLPVIEKGLEIHKLELIINPDSEEIKDCIHYSSTVLAFLRLRRLGR